MARGLTQCVDAAKRAFMGQGGRSRIRDSELMLLLERPNSPLLPISPYYYTYVQAACIVPACPL